MKIEDVRVLIIDDEFVIALDTAMRVKNLGFKEVLIASDYVQALHIILHRRPQLMIVDVYMYGFRQFSTKTLIDEYKFPTYIWNKYGIPHIYLSCIPKNSLRKIGFYKSHPIEVFIKPYKITEFTEKLIDAVSRFDGIKKTKIRNVLTNQELSTIRIIYQAEAKMANADINTFIIENVLERIKRKKKNEES